MGANLPKDLQRIPHRNARVLASVTRVFGQRFAALADGGDVSRREIGCEGRELDLPPGRQLAPPTALLEPAADSASNTSIA